MTLEDINYIAQIIGTIAIIGTFVALLIQMRQTNRLLRNQAKRAQIDGIKAISEAVYQTPGLADIMMRGVSEGLNGLTPAERMQVLSYLMTAERTWEAMFVQYQDGLIDEDLWQAHNRQTQAAINDNPVMMEFWAARREFFMPAYRAYRDVAFAAKGGGQTLGYGIKAAPSKTSAPAAESQNSTPVAQVIAPEGTPP